MRHFDNAEFQFVKDQVRKLNEYFENIEDGSGDVFMSKDPRTVVSKVTGKISTISRHWNDFEEEFSENYDRHQLGVLKKYGAEIHGDQAYWEQNRDRHEDIEGNELDYYTKEGDDPTENDQYLQIRVNYVEDESDPDDEGEYHLKMNDELYDLDIEAVRDDIQGVLSALYDLSSKFDFRKTLKMEKGQMNDDHVLQNAREIFRNESNGEKTYRNTGRVTVE